MSLGDCRAARRHARDIEGVKRGRFSSCHPFPPSPLSRIRRMASSLPGILFRSRDSNSSARPCSAAKNAARRFGKNSAKSSFVRIRPIAGNIRSRSCSADPYRTSTSVHPGNALFKAFTVTGHLERSRLRGHSEVGTLLLKISSSASCDQVRIFLNSHMA
jgi:hypothetical protein